MELRDTMGVEEFFRALIYWSFLSSKHAHCIEIGIIEQVWSQ